MKVSNAFTTSRLLAAPLVFCVYFFPVWTNLLYEVSVFVLIPLIIIFELTDFFDGFFARKYNEVSDFGKIYDPFADVVFHLTLFFCFAFHGYGQTSYLPLPIFILIFYREFCMLFLRLLAVKQGVSIAASKAGKFKTVLYVVAASYSLLLESMIRLQILTLDALTTWSVLMIIGKTLYILALIASYVSFIDYIRKSKKLLLDEKK